MAATPWDFRDEEQVKEYLEKLETEYSFQCFYENLPDGCHRYADFHELTKKDHARASAVFKKNCDENKYGHSCHKFANNKMLGQGTPKGSKTALSYYGLGCEYGYMQSCANAGLMHLVGKGMSRADPQAAVGLLQRACSGGVRESCYRLSTMYLLGWPPPLPSSAKEDGSISQSSTDHASPASEPSAKRESTREASQPSDATPEPATVLKDMARAYEYSLKACEMGMYQACANLSRMHTLGDGVPCDAEAAKKYRKRAEDIHRELNEQSRTITFGNT